MSKENEAVVLSRPFNSTGRVELTVKAAGGDLRERLRERRQRFYRRRVYPGRPRRRTPF